MINTKLNRHFLLLAVVLPVFVWAQPTKKDKEGRARMEAEGFFLDAIRFEMLEKSEDAIRLFNKSLELDEKNPAAHYKLAILLQRKNLGSEALSHAKKASEMDKTNFYYPLLLAQLQEEQGDWKGAVGTFRKMLEKFPEQEPYRLSVAQILIRKGKFKEAIKELDETQRIMGPSHELFQLRQKLFLQQNDVKGAVADGYRWMEVFPDEPDSYFGLAQLLILKERWSESLEVLKKMNERFPGNPNVALMFADVYINQGEEGKAEIEMLKAFAHPELPIGAKIDIISGFLRGMETREEKEKAIRLCNQLVEAHPGDARAYIMRGDILNRMGEKQKARDNYIKARLRDKNNFALWEQTILIDLSLNEIDSLVLHTAEARELFPNTPSFSFYNGLGNLMLKRYSSAVDALEHAKRISLENREMQFEVYSQLGDAYFNLKDAIKSFENFEEALKIDSLNSHVLNNYSYFLSLENVRLDRALSLSARLIELHPNDPTFLDTRGWVLYQSGKYPEAVVILEKATLNSKSGVVWEHFGDALFRVGRTAEAIQAWEKAKSFGGEISPELLQKIQQKKLN
jgi:tetratricopeptide (TPR) repeat protein